MWTYYLLRDIINVQFFTYYATAFFSAILVFSFFAFAILTLYLIVALFTLIIMFCVRIPHHCRTLRDKVCTILVSYVLANAKIEKKSDVGDAAIHGNALKIKYRFNNEVYEIYLPYNRRAKRDTSYKIVKKDGSEEIYNHHPSVEIVIEAKHIHANQILIYGSDDMWRDVSTISKKKEVKVESKPSIQAENEDIPETRSSIIFDIRYPSTPSIFDNNQPSISSSSNDLYDTPSIFDDQVETPSLPDNGTKSCIDYKKLDSYIELLMKVDVGATINLKDLSVSPRQKWTILESYCGFEQENGSNLLAWINDVMDMFIFKLEGTVFQAALDERLAIAAKLIVNLRNLYYTHKDDEDMKKLLDEKIDKLICIISKCGGTYCNTCKIIHVIPSPMQNIINNRD